MAFLHVSVEFDFEKYFSNTPPDPKIIKYLVNKAPITKEKIAHDVIIIFNNPHSCPEIAEPIVSYGQIHNPESDLQFLRNLIHENPLKSLQFFKLECLKQKRPVKDNQILYLLKEHRKINFPTNEDAILNPDYCLTLDQDIKKQHSFYQGKGEVVLEDQRLAKYIIFATPFSLSLLAEAEDWFADGTFKIAPKGFTQIMTIICKHRNTNFPCCYIVLSNKTEAVYLIALSHLKNLFILNKFGIRLKSVMCDFEQGLSNAFLKVFEEPEIKNCYFHYCKALYKKVSKLGLKKESLQSNTILLMAFLKIIPHLQLKEAKGFFDDLKACFLKISPSYRSLLNYYESNWLGQYFVEGPDRTNNICESFNRVINQSVGITHARLAIFVSKLKEFEFLRRTQLIEKYESGRTNSVLIPEDEQHNLPFSKIYRFIATMEENLEQVHYALRSRDMKSKIVSDLKDLAASCYNFFDSEEGLYNDEGKKVNTVFNFVELSQINEMMDNENPQEEKR